MRSLISQSEISVVLKKSALVLLVFVLIILVADLGIQAYRTNKQNSFYGQMIQPINRPEALGIAQSRVNWQGVSFACQKGDEVVAIADAKVILDREIAPYGRVIVLDHGYRLYSLYAGIDSIHVIGDELKKGEIVGSVNASITDNGRPIFYFEIRRNAHVIALGEYPLFIPVLKSNFG